MQWCWVNYLISKQFYKCSFSGSSGNFDWIHMEWGPESLFFQKCLSADSGAYSSLRTTGLDLDYRASWMLSLCSCQSLLCFLIIHQILILGVCYVLSTQNIRCEWDGQALQ